MTGSVDFPDNLSSTSTASTHVPSWLDNVSSSFKDFFCANQLDGAERRFERLTAIQTLIRLNIFKNADLNRSLFEWHMPFHIPFLGKHVKFFRLSHFYNFLFPGINFLMAGECRKEGYDPIRAAAAKAVFTGLGAETQELETDDVDTDGNKVKIESMLIRSRVLKQKIEGFGGRWEKREVEGKGLCLVIIPPAEDHEKIAEWQEFYDSTLKQMEKLWTPVDVNISDGPEQPQIRRCLVTSKNAHLLPDIDAPNKKTQLMAFSEIAIPMTMRKRRVADWLGQGLDVALYNGHGMEEREGIASEESSYEDVSTFAKYLFNQGEEGARYDPAKTCIFATCGSTFSGSYMLKQYHDRGINCLLEAPPISLKAAISSFHWLVRTIVTIALFIFSLPSFKLTNISRSVEEFLHTSSFSLRQKYLGTGEDTNEIDGWDNLGKMQGLSDGQQGYAVLIDIEGDHLSSQAGVQQQADVLKEKKAEVVSLHFDPKVKKGAHFQNGWEADELQEQILTAIHLRKEAFPA